MNFPKTTNLANDGVSLKAIAGSIQIFTRVHQAEHLEMKDGVDCLAVALGAAIAHPDFKDGDFDRILKIIEHSKQDFMAYAAANPDDDD